MKFDKSLILVLLLAVALFGIGCDDATEDAAEDALAAATGFEAVDIGCNEEYPDVDKPKGWECVFAVKATEEQAKMLDEGFELDAGEVAELTGLDFDTEYQVVFALNTEVEGEQRLRFANKLSAKENVIKLDTEANEKLGGSVGSAGAGWYGAYFADKEFGFLTGEVADCSGAKKSGVLCTASDGPFFTHTDDAGTWALPSLKGKPATVYFTDGEDCSGSSSDPVTDEENPKDPEETPDQDEFSDDTDVVDSGDDTMDDTDTTPSGEALYDFEDGTAADFVCTGDVTYCGGVSTAEYGALFPGGQEANYLFLSTGGNQVPSCTCSATFTVPEGMTELVISYDFFSQEWKEWAFTAYNDIFTAIIQGEYDYVINRTVDNTAIDDDWDPASGEGLDLVVAGVDTSADATANGPVYDGHLKWGGSDSDTPRGGVDDGMVGREATFAVEAGSTITLLLTVSDVGDKIYDSGAAIDYVEFR